MMRNIFTLILTFILTIIDASAQDYGQIVSDASMRLKQLSQTASSISTIKADFTMTHTSPMLTTAQHGVGKMSYNKSTDRLALDYSDPAGDQLLVEGGKFSITTAGRTMSAKGNQAEPLLRMIKACLTGNFETLCEKAELKYYQSSTLFTVTINPQQARFKKYVKQIILRFDNNNNLNTMCINAGNGDSTEYKYTNQIITKN